MFRNTRLGKRIAVGFSLPLVITICFGVVIYAMSDGIRDKSFQVRDGSRASFAETAYQMKLDVVQVQQFLSDISATRAQDGLDDGFKKAEECSQSFKAGMTRFRQVYEKERNQAQLQKLDELGKAFQEYYDSGKVMAKAYIDEGPAGGNKKMPAFDKAADKLSALVEPLLEQQLSDLHASLDDIASLSHLTRIAIVASGILIILCSLVVGWIITRSTTGVLRKIVEGLRSGADEVASASARLSSESRQFAEGASEQAAAIEETSSSLEEMSSMTRQNASNATQANQLMFEASKVVEKANSSMNDLTASMAEISKASEETQKIIRTIDEIAFQTNLLALNAAVEAARAGEAGAGFAVVADEVRNLAMRAAEAAKNTAALIEGTVQTIREGSGIVQRTNDDFAMVASSFTKSGELVGGITVASQEQAQGIAQLTNAVAEMDKVTQRNAESAEESASLSKQMNIEAEKMRKFVASLVGLVGRKGNSLRSVHAQKQRSAIDAPPLQLSRSFGGKNKNDLISSN